MRYYRLGAFVDMILLCSFITELRNQIEKSNNTLVGKKSNVKFCTIIQQRLFITNITIMIDTFTPIDALQCSTHIRLILFNLLIPGAFRNRRSIRPGIFVYYQTHREGTNK